MDMESINNLYISAEKNGFNVDLIKTNYDLMVLSKEMETKEKPLFRVLSQLISVFKPQLNKVDIPSSKLIKEMMLDVEEKLDFKKPINYLVSLPIPPKIKKTLRKPIFLNDPFLCIWFEILSLHWCVNQWLIPKKINNRTLYPKEALAEKGISTIDINQTNIISTPLIVHFYQDILDATKFSRDLFDSRMLEMHMQYWIHRDKNFEPLGKMASVNHLLQVAWFELATAIEYNLLVGICNICNKLMTQNDMKSKTICGAKECKKKYLEDNIVDNVNKKLSKANLPTLSYKMALKYYQNENKKKNRTLQAVIYNKISKKEAALKLGLSVFHIEELLIKKNKKGG